MIIIYHPQTSTEASDWKALLEELTVSHMLVTNHTHIPYLREGKKEVKGVEAINQFLAEYRTFMTTWNQDRCDMWFLDEPEE